MIVLAFLEQKGKRLENLIFLVIFWKSHLRATEAKGRRESLIGWGVNPINHEEPPTNRNHPSIIIVRLKSSSSVCLRIVSKEWASRDYRLERTPCHKTDPTVRDEWHQRLALDRLWNNDDNNDNNNDDKDDTAGYEPCRRIDWKISLLLYQVGLNELHLQGTDSTRQLYVSAGT